MAFSTLPAIVAGVPVPKAAWLDVVTANMAAIGGAWTADARLSTAIWTTTGAAVGNGTLLSRYRLLGKTLDWRLTLTFGTTTNAGSTQFTFTWPGGVTPLDTGWPLTVVLNDASATPFDGLAIATGSALNLRCITSAAGATGTVTATTPMTWATGDVVSFLLTGCEVA